MKRYFPSSSLGTTNKLCYLIAGVIIGSHVALLAYGGWIRSANANEPAHLVAGLSHWSLGSFALYSVNPPLVRSVAALPVVATGYIENWSNYNEVLETRPVFNVAIDFVRENGTQFNWLITIARWACIPFSVIGAVISFLWARDLYGPRSGLLAMALWCFSPLVLGHSACITPDAHAASLGLLACYTFWRWLKKPSWKVAAATGIALGLAQLSKTTLVLLFPILPTLWFVLLFSKDRRQRLHWKTECLMGCLILVLGLYTLNLGYLCEGTLKPLGTFRFVSNAFTSYDGGNRFRGTFFESIPVPLPEAYVRGIDIQQRDFESTGLPSYMRGRYENTGWWYYYCYAILVKCPLPTLVLLLLSILYRHIHDRPTHDSWCDSLTLCFPPLCIFLAASLKCSFSHHVRYILPCIPFAFVWISQLAQSTNRNTTRDSPIRWIFATLTVLLTTGTIACSLSNYPHSLSYFNMAVGGSRCGPAHLLNSNLDWGQDLRFLESWNARKEDDLPVYVAFFNYYQPFDMAIEGFEPWPFPAESNLATRAIPKGYFAISVNLLYEFPWEVHGLNPRQSYYVDRRPLAYLRSISPEEKTGYSIYVFSSDQLITAYSTPESEPFWQPDK